VEEGPLSRRNLFSAGAAFAAVLAEAAAADPLFAAARPDLPLTSWAASGYRPGPGPENDAAAAPGDAADAADAAAAPITSGLPAPDPLVFLVNRLTFGQQTADLGRANELGWDGFVEEQLNPEQIDDSAVDAALGAFPTLFMRPDRLLDMDKQTVTGQLIGAAILRAIYSKRQLLELMVDFWTNHFNIYVYEKLDYWLKTVDDRAVIRRHALGNFNDLLNASAASPAMLSYLDNASNTKKGPNENYAREMMELHTLGLNGGYTQQDVQEVARCFTGWTIQGTGRQRGTFKFNPGTHDDGAHTFLGQPIAAGQGMGQGLQVLSICANHPATATHVATKLCVRFVSDSPPASLVKAAAATFTATGGEIREVMRTILGSDELRAAADQKLRRPFELAVAAVRALDAQISGNGLASLAGSLYLMGQVPFNWQPPNGYPDANPAWTNTNGMLSRWNLGLALGANALPGVTADLSVLPGRSAAQIVELFAARLLARPLLAADRDKLIAWVAAGKAPNAPLPAAQVKARVPGLVALALDSPYFQWR
jgi:uncharacterized protein (DUF1800 family)